MNRKIARLITTFACNRSCKGCCNSYPKIMARGVHISDVSFLASYDEVCITGGEPLLEPDRTMDVIKQVRQHAPGAKVYLYTSLVTPHLSDLMDAVDGVQFSLHYESDQAVVQDDLRGLEIFQVLSGQLSDKSMRLNVDSRISWPVPIRPACWQRIKVMPWLTEPELIAAQPYGLPAGEMLFVLED